VIVTEVAAVTGLVVIGNVAVVAFAGTVKDAGTVAAFVLLLARVTSAPPAGAAALSVTVPVLPVPAGTVTGFTESPVKGARMAIVTILLAPL
jgi:hypothetical protein